MHNKLEFPTDDFRPGIASNPERVMDKKIHEAAAKFFEAPTRHGFRDLLRLGVGETDNVDFKAIFPEKTKLAKHLLAFANSGGGVIVIGVTDGENFEAVGLDTAAKKDKADIQKQVSEYLPSSLAYEVLDFSYEASEYPTLMGKTFQVIVIESNDEDLPYICRKSGEQIRDTTLYVRKGTNSVEASHDDVQKILNKRIETKISTTNVLELKEHLEQLKLLYGQIPPTRGASETGSENGTFGSLLSMTAKMQNFLNPQEPNPHYPKESYQQFVAKMIEAKKLKISQVIEV